ncbi:uncharacterized protein LOC143886057 [Tasmannia lanceolata]|uniref:uncharacterized protein LOC143886057 n=1 Tax=Tasmannia lanceolata TaxID=3420 RepID=UPI004062FE94
MDFSTVRKKLTGGTYANLEQFEEDVFLICSNAMQYNAPVTIYFQQARSIHELARKDFENLRQDSEDNEPELKSVRRGRPPGKSSIKRPVGKPPLERAGSDFSSDTTLATPEDPTHDQLRKAHDHAGITDMPTRNSHGAHNGETFGWLAEHKSDRNDDFPGSVLKGLSNIERKQLVFDENRRSAYKQPNQPISARETTILTTFDREKQLISVIAWKIASGKIEIALSKGLKFGPGWVGENEAPRLQPPLASSSPPRPPPPPPLSQSFSQPRISSSTTIPRALESKGDILSETQEPSKNSSLEGSFRTTPSIATSALDSRTDTTEGYETIRGTNYESGIRPKPHFQLNQKIQNPEIHSTVNGLNSGFESNVSSQVGKLFRPAGAVGNFSSEAFTPSRMINMVPRRNETLIQSMPGP